ncbi:MAG: DUF5667 domain-containing protein [Candidatus Paceibacterota bacterium]|jgi:hypothetical protein
MINDLFKKIKKETLSSDEKSQILSVLESFVDQNPIQSVRSPFYSSWFIFQQKMVVVPIAIILVFVLTSGTVFAAKNSLPGNILYPVKILNEKVESFVTFDTETKAQVDASHAISRLNEVEQIVNSNQELDTETRQKIESHFTTQSENTIKHIDELKSKGLEKEASKIETDFHKSLGEYEKTITDLSNSTSTENKTKKELDSVVSNIRSQLEKRSDTDEDDHDSEEQREQTTERQRAETETREIERTNTED